MPTKEAAAKLYEEMDFQRAVQAYLWGRTIVGMEQNLQGLVHDTGAKSGDLALYDDFRSKSTIMAANNCTPYIYGYIDLSEKGPMVLDYPPGPSAGAVADWWERPVMDVGLPGADQGKGATYLLLGPGQENAQGCRGLSRRHASRPASRPTCPSSYSGGFFLYRSGLRHTTVAAGRLNAVGRV